MGYDGHIIARDPGLAWEIEDMPEGFKGYVRYDDSPESPREWAHVSTLVQNNDRRGDVDQGEELREARERWDWTDDRGFFGYMPTYYDTPTNRALHKVGREALIQRYIRIFRPDIVHYVDYWSAGRDLYGWGYITREAWGEDSPSIAPGAVFDAEVETYRQWADGEVYGVTVVRESDGAEESLWSVYDDQDGYIEQVAAELVEELS